MKDTITSTNKYAHISLITKKTDAQHILLRCNYNILINKIDKEEIDLAKEINRHIEAIKES